MNPVQHILILVVRLYRWTLSPAKTFLFGPLGQCRFTPSCSEYAVEAIQTRGVASGLWLAVRRIRRCHPWGGCGHDPVPGAEITSQKSGAGSGEGKGLAGYAGTATIQHHTSHCH
jgi:putative membrane protein insertion efficiency factor